MFEENMLTLNFKLREYTFNKKNKGKLRYLKIYTIILLESIFHQKFQVFTLKKKFNFLPAASSFYLEKKKFKFLPAASKSFQICFKVVSKFTKLLKLTFKIHIFSISCK